MSKEFVTSATLAMEPGFVEQCFAVWTNVVEFKDNKVDNSDHPRERVSQYIKSYYLAGFIDNLEEWECELHME